MNQSTYGQRDRARRKVDREVIPGYLKDTFEDIQYWENRLKFWQYQEAQAEPDAPYRATINRKIVEVTKILAAFYQDARQLNRKLR
jgi:hypothetical protein